MKVAVPVLIALTVLVIGSALVRGRAREESPTPGSKAVGSAPAPLKPLPVCASATGTQAVRIIGLYREQHGLRGAAPGAAYSEEQVRRLRSIDQSLAEEGIALAASLRANAESWKDLITLLPALEEYDSARDLLLRVRGAIDPSSEALWIEQLRTAARADDRRLALLALAGRSSRDVVQTLAARAREDADRRVRAEALRALAELRRHPLAQDLARTVTDTLNARASAEQDPAVREVAAALATTTNDAGRSPVPSSRRSPFGKGPKAPSDQNP